MVGLIVAALAALITAHDWKMGLCVGGPNGGEELEPEKIQNCQANEGRIRSHIPFLMLLPTDA